MVCFIQLISIYQITTIINHTMLENYQLTRQMQSSNSTAISTQTTLILKLNEQINQCQLQLSVALSLNQLLVQQATLFDKSHSIVSFNNQTQSIEGQIKMEVPSSEPIKLQDDVEQLTQKHKIVKSKQDRDKNQTKNIPKNYGKAILSFIQQNIKKYSKVVKPILQKERLTLNDLLAHIKRHKKQVNSINYLKEIWGYYDKNNPILKCIRILSYIFMRKHCLAYIFNSRVKNYFSHIKYRNRIIQGIEHPEQFTCIKQF